MKNKPFEIALQSFLDDPQNEAGTHNFLLHALCLKSKVYASLDPEKDGVDEVVSALEKAFTGISVQNEQLKELYWMSEALVILCTNKELTDQQRMEAGELGKFLGTLVSVVNSKFPEPQEISVERKKTIQKQFLTLAQQKTDMINSLMDEPEIRVSEESHQFGLSMPPVEEALENFDKHAWQLILNKQIVNELTKKTGLVLEKTKPDNIFNQTEKPTFKK